jgi:hypothetical protein
VAGLLLLVGCASNGRSGGTGEGQAIHIGSEPDGAACELIRGGHSLGKVTTPAPIAVSRGKGEPIDVVCTKPGYAESHGLLTIETQKAQPYSGSPNPDAVAGVFALAYLIDKATHQGPGYRKAISVPLQPSVGTAAAPTAADGDYGGSAPIDASAVLTIAVHVVAGGGRGSISQTGCGEPGKLDLAVDASGRVTGTASGPLAAGCGVRTATAGGKVEAGTLRLWLGVENGRMETFALTRKPK